MKNTLFGIGICLLVFLFDNIKSNDKNYDDEHSATCYGNKSCYACKNCKYCKHCNAGGGSCGVCSSTPSLPVASLPVKSTIKSVPSKTSVSSSQCKGTTKKGARCKRVVKGVGYCWQHG